MAIHDTRWRTENAGRLLFSAVDRFTTDTLDFLRFHGFASVSEALLAIFQNLDPDGTWITVIALRAGLTTQSMMELVDKAEALGLVERRPDPKDKRAKIVVLNALGREALARLREGVALAEKSVEQAMERDFLDVAKQHLIAYAAAADPRSALLDEIRRAPDSAEWRMRNAARIFRVAQTVFAADLLSVAREQGADQVTPVQLALYRNLDLAGTRLTDIAARARMNKPPMLELVKKALALGFVERRPDLSDGRAKLICFTGQGLQMLECLHKGVIEAELRMSDVMGKDFLVDLKSRLRAYVVADGISRMVDDDPSSRRSPSLNPHAAPDRAGR